MRKIKSESNQSSNQSPNFTGWSIYHFLSTNYTSSIEGFFPIFISSMGANLTQIGFLVGIVSLVNISQLFWAQIAALLHNSRIFVVLGRFIHAFLYLGYIVLFLVHQARLILLFFFRILQSFFQASTIPNYSSLLARHIPQQNRPQRMNRFYRIGIIGSLSGTLIGGIIFSLITDYGNLPADVAFFTLFCWAALLGVLASMCFYYSVPSLEASGIDMSFEDASARKISASFNFSKFLHNFPNFRKFLLFALIFYFALSFAAPYYIILEIEYYRFSYFTASILTSITISTQLLTSLIVSRLRIIEKLGKRLLIFISLFLIAFASSFIIIPYYFEISALLCFIFAWIIIGIGEGLFNITMSIFILDIVHPKYRVELIAIYNTLIAISVFIGPILGGITIQFFQNISISFLGRSCMILISSLFLTRVNDPVITGSLFEPIRLYFSRHLKTESPLSSDFDVLQK